MESEKKYFLAEDAQLDADSSAFAVSPNSWVNMQNLRVRTTDAGVTMVDESIGGTLLLSIPQPSITFLTIGAAEETERSRFCEFKYCTTAPWHKIVCWDDLLQQEFDVLLSSQVTGGLNFDKNKLIHSARIVDGLLYWTDDLNDQRKVNIDAGIKLNQPSYVTDEEPYESPIDPKVITVLRPPPLYSLYVLKVTQPSLQNNFIKLGAFQFAYNYHYRDGETSVLSNYSQLIPYNLKEDTFNRVDISILFAEVIPQDAQIVNIALRYGNTPNFFTIKTWDKRIPADLAAIEAHNARTTALSFSFYNNQIGQALDSAYSVKPFDNVPVRSSALEVATERLFLGDNVIGYDTPITTSLTAAFISTSEGATPGAFMTRFFFDPVFGGDIPKSRFGLYIPSISTTNYYCISTGLIGDYPNPTDFTTLTAVAPAGLQSFFGILGTYNLTISLTGATVTLTNTPSPVSLAGSLVFKSDAPYRAAVQFYDYGDRKSGIVDNGEVYETPDRDFNTIAFTTSLDWLLSNANAVNEIPSWATHYAVVVTKCLRTSSFLQARTANLTYVTKDPDGTYIFDTDTYAATLKGVGIDITSLNNFGMGYVFAEGDLITIYDNGATEAVTLKILAQDGNFLVAELSDFGVIGDTGSPYTNALFEIYTPYYQSFNEAFYERGAMYSVLFPGTVDRQYSVTGDSIRGDVVILERSGYLTENMSYNDTYYQNWYTDAGRPCFKDFIGQKTKTNSIVWSNVYIPGSNNNGLSSFDVLDEQLLPIECGSLSKLQLTSKVNNEMGLVMLAICGRETASLYLGEAQLVAQTGNAFVASSQGVIGTINVLKGSRGTTHPESVCEYRGNVFWWDDVNARIVQYSVSGLFDISNYKMTRFWNLFTQLFNSMSVEEIEALGSRPFVFTTVDPYHGELLISIPKLSNTAPKGNLPDFPFIMNPFDVWDAQGKTMVYKLGEGEGRPIWLGSYSFNPEWFITLTNKLYSFYYGSIYIHNQVSNPCEFYGIQYSSKIMIVGNKDAGNPKEYNNTAVEANLKPDFVYMYNTYPIEQSSYLINDDFRDYEGIYRAYIKRNNLRITENGYVADNLMTGEKMRNVAMLMMFEWRVVGTALNLKFIDIGYSLSRGYNI